MSDNLTFALIPARGGSKGIPRKNIREVAGKSLIARAVSIAKDCKMINKVIVSTDDNEMAEEGMKHGADNCIIRSDILASDMALSIDVWRDAWLKAEELYSFRFDFSVLLEPTSPLRTVEDVELTLSKIIKEKLDSALTVSPTPAHFTPNKTLMIENGKLKFYHNNGINNTLRQTIPNYYHRNGLCYAISRKQIFEKNNIVDNFSVPIIIERNVVNIDDPFELKQADWMLKNKLN